MTVDNVKPTVGFIGLGIMGRPMAENLIRAGYPLIVYNRTPQKMEAVVKLGAKSTNHPAQVCDDSDIVITMLPDTPDVDQVYFGDHGIMNRVRAGQILIDMSTVSPRIARKIAEEAQAKGAESLDAPVSGGDIGAKEGTLSIMVGGSVHAFERAYPLFQVMGKNIVHIGPSGAGQVTKTCNQIVVAITIEAIGEALVLAEKSGVDPAKVRSALLGGFASSRILEIHGQRVLDRRFEPGFKMRLHRKDLNIALDTAQDMEVSTPLTALVHDMMNSLLAQGKGELDHSYLVAEIAKRANLAME